MMKWFLFAVPVVLLAGVAAAVYIWRGREAAPDPGRIAFWQEAQGDAPNLFVMDPDGSGRPRALVKGFEPAWSPDGELIAFTLEENPLRTATSDIWVLHVDDPDRVRRLATLAPLYAKHPHWSPDGKMIAFEAVAPSDENPNYDIYVIPASGGTVTALTRTAADEGAPSWSPDGREIAYWHYGDPELDSPDIWVMNADGSEQRAVTHTRDFDYSPAWSPDGEQIAFQRQYPAPGSAINNEIVVVNTDGSGFRRLTRNGSFDDFEPAWSPDGNQIAFMSDRTGVEELFVIDADGGGLEQLTRHSADSGGYLGPAWGPSP